MAHALLIVGDSLKLNPLMLAYIERAYVAHFLERGNTYFVSKNDTKLFMTLESLVHQYDTLSIGASSESFHLVGKVLSTLTEDTLVLKEETLAPSKATQISKGSYVLTMDEKQVNVLEISQNKTLPAFLSDVPAQKTSFSLIGIDEDSCRILLEPLAQTFEIGLHVTPLVEGWISIAAKAQKYGQIEHFLKSVGALFGDKMFRAQHPVEHIVSQLAYHKKQITCAESCTGGLIASMLTKTPGASACLFGSLVTYANTLKRAWLGVDAHILKTRGAVSEECVHAMLAGALNASKADIALATSGIAGPDGGSEQKPIGTVFVGVGNKEGMRTVERLLLQGDREYIQQQSAYHALRLLIQTHPHLFLR